MCTSLSPFFVSVTYFIYLLALPFIIIFGIFYLIKYCITKKKNNNLSDHIKGFKFNPARLHGDMECSICNLLLFNI